MICRFFPGSPFAMIIITLGFIDSSVRVYTDVLTPAVVVTVIFSVACNWAPYQRKPGKEIRICITLVSDIRQNAA